MVWNLGIDRRFLVLESVIWIIGHIDSLYWQYQYRLGHIGSYRLYLCCLGHIGHIGNIGIGYIYYYQVIFLTLHIHNICNPSPNDFNYRHKFFYFGIHVVTLRFSIPFQQLPCYIWSFHRSSWPLKTNLDPSFYWYPQILVAISANHTLPTASSFLIYVLMLYAYHEIRLIRTHHHPTPTAAAKKVNQSFLILLE